MNILVKVLIGLVAGYIIGIILAAIAAFALGFEDVARFLAIGCGIVGAAVGPTLVDRLQGRNR